MGDWRKVLIAVVALIGLCGHAQAADRPNILWITAEDMSPDLGCYGVAHASTPNLDRFAAGAVRYTHAFATIGVCAPSRSTLITGMYPTSIGTHPMRCNGRLPEFVKCFPEYLRAAGYYCTNNAKEDYNFKTPPGTWDESSNKAHWRKRKPGQPFFAVFNLGSTHESQIWAPPEELARRRATLKPGQVHDPATIPLPPFHPDTPEVRTDWANYHDNVSYMDTEFAAILRHLEEDGLAEDTIVFFFSDHGAGMPRSKRWLYDSGLRVPLLVHFPEKYRHLAPAAAGQAVDRLVSFVDFAPTVLGLAGVEIPKHMQGTSFMGPGSGPPRQFIYGFRDRMDERYDMTRCVRDRRYKYIRNYHPQRPYFQSQHLEYARRMPTLRVWERLAREGKLDETQALWMGATKPPEELYDTEADPWEIHNLAATPEHEQTLERMRKAHLKWVVETVDLGFLPEAEMRERAAGTTEYEWARGSADVYPLARIAETAQLADQPKTSAELGNRLKDPDAVVRYWATIGLGRKLRTAPTDRVMRVQSMMREDPSWSVRLAAAEALMRWGKHEGLLDVLGAGLKHEQPLIRVVAANLLDHLDGKAAGLIEPMRAAVKDPTENVRRVMEHAVGELDGTQP